MGRDRTIRVADTTCSTMDPDSISYLNYPAFDRCREIFNSNVRRTVNNSTAQPTKLDKFRLVVWNRNRITTTTPYKPSPKPALNAVNIIEKYKGWKPTRIYNVEVTDFKGYHTKSYLFMAPKQWLSSSYMSGLYMLLVRALLRASKEYGECNSKIMYKDIDDLTEKLRPISPLPKRYTELMSITSTLNPKINWRTIIDNYKELHKGGMSICWLGTKRKLSPCSVELSNLFGDGPTSLMEMESKNEVIQKRFEKISGNCLK